MQRREFLGAAGAVGAAVVLTGAGAEAGGAIARPGADEPPKRKGRIRHSVCRWCYGGMPLEELCRSAAALGMSSVELLSENEWHIPAQFGLSCAVANGPTQIVNGLNRPDLHDAIVREGERLLPLVKAAGIPSMIVFSGNRRACRMPKA